MSVTGVFGLVLLLIIAISIIGPRKLPQGLEQLWLLLTNLRLTNGELPPSHWNKLDAHGSPTAASSTA